MGLDMYLRGSKYCKYDGSRMEDGFRLTEVTLDLGYWRKHANLHGAVVQMFAGGVDKCQRIDLSADDLAALDAAVRSRQLPHTEGFFFGASDNSDEEVEQDLATLRAAKDWLLTKDEGHYRSVYYQASW